MRAVGIHAVLSTLSLSSRTPPPALLSTVAAPTGCEALLKSLFAGPVDAGAVAAACSEKVEWDDMGLSAPAVGRDAVRELIAAKFPGGSSLVLDRVSDGQRSGGAVWHREAADREGVTGLRGTLFVELDDDEKIAYVREGCEPILKPGQATEALLKAVANSVERPPKEAPTFAQATPTGAASIVRYLWEEAYPGGAEPTEALRLFSERIVYEDFNYPEPFVGKADVAAFVTAFDIPGIEFVPLRVSEGERACAFTWKVVVNGQDGPSGVSFYEVDEAGAVCFIRDIPAPSPAGFRPLAALAEAVDPELRLLSPAKLASAALGVASVGMGLLRPLFAAEARWQAELLADEQAAAAAAAELDAEVGRAPVVVYTYGLSPFSTEACALLDAAGCAYEKVELGAEWFLLGPAASAKRAALLERTGQSSLPHVFVGGESVGGLHSGTPGLVELKRQGKLLPMLTEAGAM